MIERYKELTPRGEYVLVVEGKPKVKENEDITLADAALMAKELVDGEICRQALIIPKGKILWKKKRKRIMSFPL